jgi:hypothetical protein
MTIKPLFTTFVCIALIVTAAAPAAEVTLPATLGTLADDPNDPADDANAFFTSPSGRYRFSRFAFTPVGVGLTPPGENDIRVEVSESGNSVTVAFEFTANGAATGPAAYELALEYEAQALNPQFGFVSHTLSMDGAATGGGSVFINEEILAPGGGGIGNVSTTLNVPNRPNTLSDTLTFAPTRTMTVHNKDISVSGGTGTAGPNSASLVRIEQTFAVIPEPSGLTLAALGILGLGMAWRRLHRTNRRRRP